MNDAKGQRLRFGSHVTVKFTCHEPLTGTIIDLDIDHELFRVHYDDYNVESPWLPLRVPTIINRVTIL